MSQPSRCPTCGRVAEVLVGTRGYCAACARTMRLFLGDRGKELGPIVPSGADPLLVRAQ